MINVRASLNRLVTAIADPGVPVLCEPNQDWVDPCYRVEFLDAELPRGSFLQRNARIHVRGTMGTIEAEARMRRLLDGLGLKTTRSVAAADLYDYAANQDDPAQVGTFKIERSPRGVSVITTQDNPTMRHLVVSLVVVYQQ